MKLSRRVYIDPLFFVTVAALLLAGYWMELLCMLPALLLHELSHIAVSSACGLSLREVRLTPFGCCISFDTLTHLPSPRLVLTAAAGPAANLVVAAALFPFADKSPFLEGGFYSNAALAAINLLPVLPLDGGRILSALLSDALSPSAVRRALLIAGAVLGAAIIGAGVWYCLRVAFNLTLPLFGVLLVFYALRLGNQTDLCSIALRERKGVLPVRPVAARASSPLSDVLPQLDARRYNLVYVVSPERKKRRFIDERELVAAAIERGVDTPIGTL